MNSNKMAAVREVMQASQDLQRVNGPAVKAAVLMRLQAAIKAAESIGALAWVGQHDSPVGAVYRAPCGRVYTLEPAVLVY